MVINELNFLYLSFFLFLFSIIVNVTTSLHLLLTAEMLWILLYIISLFIGYVYNSLNLLTLTFFLLILSAVEFSVGLILMLIQHIIFRSINLNANSMSTIKFFNKWSTKLKLNKLSFY